MKKPLLDIKNLDIGYSTKGHGKSIQTSLNLSLKAGEIICLIGPNGSGKSTLIKTLGRIIPPVKGEIFIGEKRLSVMNQVELSQTIGLVLTDHFNVMHLKAIDVISMGRYPYTGFWGKLKKKDWQIINEINEKVGIQNLIKRAFNELSDGERQKVMIAKALAQQTPLILLDEPTAYLDFPTKSSLLMMLRNLAKEQQIGIILSTHDIELALKTADQMWIFPEHQKMIDGIPEDLVLDGTINKVFHNKEMVFDLQTGHFERQFQSQKCVQVIGDSVKSYWLTKALHRNEISSNGPSNVTIEVTDRFIISKNEQKIAKFESIKEVLNFLQIQ